MEKEIWAWFLQRLTGIGLAVLLAIHIWVTHYENLGFVAFVDVKVRLQTLLFVTIDLLLLLFVTYHALNGLRSVILDFEVGQRFEKPVNLFLLALGFLTFSYGAIILFAFLGG